MALSKSKKRKLIAEGMSAADVKRLESILDAEDGDADNGDRSGGSQRVVVYEGEQAEEFMRGLFGKGEDEGAEDTDEDEDADEDEKPPAKTRWFG